MGKGEKPRTKAIRLLQGTYEGTHTNIVRKTECRKQVLGDGRHFDSLSLTHALQPPDTTSVLKWHYNFSHRNHSRETIWHYFNTTFSEDSVK